MRRYKCIVEYDGTSFVGWQRQTNGYSVQEAVEKSLESITQEKITPAGMPNFEMKTDEDGKDFEFVAAFEVYPEVEVKDIANIKVEKPAVEITDKDLSNMIDTLRKQHANYKEVKRKAKKDDKVTIDFIGTIDGEEFDGGKSEDFALEMGKDRMIHVTYTHLTMPTNYYV
mgnify:CR=1 FL=1